MIHLLRCVHENVFHDLKKGVFQEDCVAVYYGFDSYNASVATINKLVDIVKRENPEIKEEDMDVTFITRGMSIRHAHFTMIYIRQPVEHVKNNLNDYTIL